MEVNQISSHSVQSLFPIRNGLNRKLNRSLNAVTGPHKLGYGEVDKEGSSISMQLAIATSRGASYAARTRAIERLGNLGKTAQDKAPVLAKVLDEALPTSESDKYQAAVSLKNAALLALGALGGQQAFDILCKTAREMHRAGNDSGLPLGASSQPLEKSCVEALLAFGDRGAECARTYLPNALNCLVPGLGFPMIRQFQTKSWEQTRGEVLAGNDIANQLEKIASASMCLPVEFFTIELLEKLESLSVQEGNLSIRSTAFRILLVRDRVLAGRAISAMVSLPAGSTESLNFVLKCLIELGMDHITAPASVSKFLGDQVRQSIESNRLNTLGSCAAVIGLLRLEDGVSSLSEIASFICTKVKKASPSSVDQLQAELSLASSALLALARINSVSALAAIDQFAKRRRRLFERWLEGAGQVEIRRLAQSARSLGSDTIESRLKEYFQRNISREAADLSS